MDLPLCLAYSMEVVRHRVETGGYFVLFILLFGCGLGMPLPEDVPLLIAGTLVTKHLMSLPVAAVVAWCGIIGGDCMLYWIARRLGLEIMRLPLIGKHVTRTRIERVEHLFERWGVLVVGVGRMFAGIRGATVIAAGVARFSFIKFIVVDGIAAIFSGGLFIALGYWFGTNMDFLRQRLRGAEHYLVAVAGVLILLLAIYLRWRHKRHSTLAIAALDKVAEKVESPPAPATPEQK